MNKISFQIQPASESNDHQVRILIDDEDILGKDYLGIDPPVFFSQPNINKDGELMIGRCTCGDEGCSSYPVNVKVNENTISWTDDHGLNLVFDRNDYAVSFNKAANDHSWEDINRRVERLVTNILKGTKTKDNYSFGWASARIKNKNITLSYHKNNDQELFDIKWDGSTAAGVEDNAIRFKKEL